MSLATNYANWWRTAVIYQIYPRSFQDTTGNGIGDLEGIRRRLEHILRLGANAIWISPFYPSPMCDFGYDVSDYKGVDPLFGLIEEFKSLLDDAHALGLRVIIDQVWSHTSDQHAWFRESRQDSSNSKANWYTWAEAKTDGSPPNNWQSVFGGSAWTWETRREQYYLHNFLTEQPDLNFHDSAVQDAILDVARFWFDLGVDGFRLDVCNFYFQDRALRDNPARADGRRGPNPHDWQSHLYCRSQPENLSFLERLRSLADEYGATCLMGEIGDDEGQSRLIEYTSGNQRLHTAYCFDLLADRSDAAFMNETLKRWETSRDGWPTWAIGNHDVPRVATRWSLGSPTVEKTRLFAAFQMSLRGTICVYQGEELGLGQAYVPFERLQDPEGKAFWPGKPGRDGCRTPMPWEEKAHQAGFSDGTQTWLPIASQHLQNAVDKQECDTNSVLSLYRKLIALRQQVLPLKVGSMSTCVKDDQVLIIERETLGSSVTCAFNLGDEGAGFRLKCRQEILLVQEGLTIDASDHMQLSPWGWAILQNDH